MNDLTTPRSHTEDDFAHVIRELVRWQARVTADPEGAGQTIADSYALVRLAMRWMLVTPSDEWLDAFDHLAMEADDQEEFIRRLRLGAPNPERN